MRHMIATLFLFVPHSCAMRRTFHPRRIKTLPAMRKRGDVWTEAAAEALREMASLGISKSEAARRLGRHPARISVRSRRAELRWTPAPKQPRKAKPPPLGPIPRPSGVRRLLYSSIHCCPRYSLVCNKTANNLQSPASNVPIRRPRSAIN